MAFPNEPTDGPGGVGGSPIPVPLWAETTTDKQAPKPERKDEGWVKAGLGLDYGEAPPFQWFNYLQFAYGRWISYVQSAFAYLKAGNFDNGVNVLNAQNVKYYNSANTYSIGLAASPFLTATSNYFLPVSLPASPTTANPGLNILQSGTGGEMRWSNVNAYSVYGNHFPSVSPYLGGVPDGYIGQQIRSYMSISNPTRNQNIDLASIQLPPGIWDISCVGYFFANVNQLQMGISLVNADFAGCVYGDSLIDVPIAPSGINTTSGSIPNFRLVITSTMGSSFVYLVCYLGGSSASLAAGRLSATRVG